MQLILHRNGDPVEHPPVYEGSLFFFKGLFVQVAQDGWEEVCKEGFTWTLIADPSLPSEPYVHKKYTEVFAELNNPPAPKPYVKPVEPFPLKQLQM